MKRIMRKPLTSDRDSRHQTAPNHAESGEGSMRYRVVALLAMLLLAIGALGVGIWSYFR